MNGPTTAEACPKGAAMRIDSSLSSGLPPRHGPTPRKTGYCPFFFSSTSLSPLNPMDVATRRAWNALQPVSLLPFDVVTRIIRLVADLDPAGWTVTCAGDRRTELGWIESTTHVYSHWRDCALNDRLLWARRACEIPNEEVFDELVLRAGSMPITLNNIR